MELTGTELRNFSGKVPNADSRAPASHFAQISSLYSGKGANSPQPDGPLINTPVRVSVLRNFPFSFNANGIACSAISAIDISLQKTMDVLETARNQVDAFLCKHYDLLALLRSCRRAKLHLPQAVEFQLDHHRQHCDLP